MKSNSFKSTDQSLRSFTIELPKDPLLKLNDNDPSDSEQGIPLSGAHTSQDRSFNDVNFIRLMKD